MTEDDVFEREKHHWWKTKKWAYFNLNRLFVRYVAKGRSSLGGGCVCG